MKVKELIEILEAMDQEAIAVCYAGEREFFEVVQAFPEDMDEAYSDYPNRYWRNYHRPEKNTVPVVVLLEHST